jgi:hypothetical protein
MALTMNGTTTKDGHPAPTQPAPPELFNARSVVQLLERMMHELINKECTPATANAACNCAARITDLLRLHVEVERLRRVK